MIACNTSTAHALEALREASPVPVLGVIEPGARAAVSATRQGRGIGVIGTAGTVASQAYHRRPFPRLLPGSPGRAGRMSAARCRWWKRAGSSIRRPGVESRMSISVRFGGPACTLVLGCTHYPLLKPLLRQVMGSDVALIDSAEETAPGAWRTRSRRGKSRRRPGRAPTHRFAVSDDAARFLAVGGRFLGDRLAEAEVVDLSP